MHVYSEGTKRLRHRRSQFTLWMLFFLTWCIIILRMDSLGRVARAFDAVHIRHACTYFIKKIWLGLLSSQESCCAFSDAIWPVIFEILLTRGGKYATANVHINTFTYCLLPFNRGRFKYFKIRFAKNTYLIWLCRNVANEMKRESWKRRRKETSSKSVDFLCLKQEQTNSSPTFSFFLFLQTEESVVNQILFLFLFQVFSCMLKTQKSSKSTFPREQRNKLTSSSPHCLWEGRGEEYGLN